MCIILGKKKLSTGSSLSQGKSYHAWKMIKLTNRRQMVRMAYKNTILAERLTENEHTTYASKGRTTYFLDYLRIHG